MSKYNQMYARMAAKALMLKDFSKEDIEESSLLKANTKPRVITDADVENEKKKILAIRNSRKKSTEKKLYRNRAARKCSR